MRVFAECFNLIPFYLLAAGKKPQSARNGAKLIISETADFEDKKFFRVYSSASALSTKAENGSFSFKSVKEYPGTGKEANFNSILEKILTDLSKNRGANSLIFYKFRFVGTI